MTQNTEANNSQEARGHTQQSLHEINDDMLLRYEDEHTTMDMTPVQLMGTSSSDAPAVAFVRSSLVSAMVSERLRCVRI